MATAIGKNTSLTVPLNAAGYIGEMASYPQDKGPCRPLKFPSLDLFYDACEEAEVRCEHVYLYRDPYEVIKSTTMKRHFNQNVLVAIHQYTTMLYTIYGQMATYPDQTAACFGLEADDDGDMVAYEGHWGRIRDLFWDGQSRDVFNKLIEEKFKLPPAPAENIKARISSYPAFMKSMVRASNKVEELCRHQLQDRHLG